MLLILLACASGPDPAEWLTGGDTTNTMLLGSNAFLRPASNLSPENETHFYSGNSFFNQSWVEAPASTENRDGLGPLFNARSCSGCHFRDGKGTPPDHGQPPPFEGLLVRLSVEGGGPDPVYGGQLQDLGLPGVPGEATPIIHWLERPGEYPDGTPYTLVEPSLTLEDPQYGDFAPDLQTSLRLAPQMIGLGLLEAIPEARLDELADPSDADGDGISGRVQVLDDGTVGRFGWKADSPDVEHQSAGAFAGDMGLTSRLNLVDDCTEAQPECTEHPNGGSPELTDTIFDRTVLYSRTVAPPVRRIADDPQVMAGQQHFHDAGCASCHVPSHTTGSSEIPALEGQLIWPYTDLLLHDMGPELSDGRPVAGADGAEWRTPPLWGVGLISDVSGNDPHYLHDGRARSLEEAILWHGGEAEDARNAYMDLSEAERAALIAFVEDL